MFLGAQVFKVSLGKGESRIESVLSISEGLGCRILSKGHNTLSTAPETGLWPRWPKSVGESGIDLTEYSEDGSPQSIEARFATSMRIGQSSEEVPFECPPWVRLKWEDNHLRQSLTFLSLWTEVCSGDHNLEWVNQNDPEISPSSGRSCGLLGDFQKPLPDGRASGPVGRRGFLGYFFETGRFSCDRDFVLNPHDMESGRTYPDSVAPGRSPLDLEGAMLCSMRGKVALPHPFEIPLRCLYSKSVKNLFFAGGHASCSSRASASLRHPPTSAQLGEAVG